MEQHTHPELAVQINGFGTRVNEVQTSQAEERVKTKRNEEDIQKIYDMIETNAQTIGKVEKSVASLTGKVSGVVAVVMVIIELAKTFIK